MPEGLTFAFAVVLTISAPLTGWLAFRRERPPIAWFIFGALSGPLAIGILFLAPPGQCPRCDTVVTGWPSICSTCGRRFHGDAITAPITPSAPEVTEPDPPPASLRPSRRAPVGRAGKGRASDAVPVPAPAAPRARATGLWTRLGPLAADGHRMAESTVTADPMGSAAPPREAPPREAPPREAPPRDAPEERGLQMVASGIFTGGSARLEIGSRYGICRDGQNLVILGPVDRTPNKVQITLPIDEMDILSVADRVQIATQNRGHAQLAMAFISAAGLRGEALEEVLARVTADLHTREPR